MSATEDRTVVGNCDQRSYNQRRADTTFAQYRAIRRNSSVTLRSAPKSGAEQTRRAQVHLGTDPQKDEQRPATV